MQKTDFSPPYARKNKYPPPPARRREPVTVKDCWREIGFALLLSAAFTVFALLFWLRHNGFAEVNLLLVFAALTQAWSARKNLRRVQRGEIVSGELAWSHRQLQLLCARLMVSAITVIVILWVIGGVTVFQDHKSWILPLAEMCFLWLLVTWAWRRHLNS